MPGPRLRVGIAALALIPALAVSTPAAADGPLARVSASLAGVLDAALPGQAMTVLVHGTSAAAAADAVRQAGMTRVTAFERIGVEVARGTAAQVAAVRALPGVTYVENNDPIEFFASSGTAATTSRQAQQTLTGANGRRLAGSGVTVAVIDSGIDPTHPAFRGDDGRTRVVRNLKSVCLDGSTAGTSCVIDLPTVIDTDTLAVGGHGTHVSGIAAGRDYTLGDGTVVGGSAPDAKIVSISTGAVILIVGADSALNWVLENHAAPCGAGVPASVCPPIKVINNSYGPVGGGQFDPESATVKLQRALVAEGVVVVWANGNDGGDGSASLSNPPGQDPTPGVLSVASYNDQGTGTRDGAVSDFSSRGAANDTSTWPDISAPGEDIVSACRLYLPICATGLQPVNGPGLLDLGTYNVISGTSMAAPQIAGIVAQLFQADPTATPAEVEAALKSTAHKFTDGAAYQPVGAYTSSFDKGTGLVDTVAAVNALVG
ncbi:S8 family serine peptidase [Actinokineospora sp. UTMC 2448]|uniref:S8 family serine peptidase n=1 Tax=Actinokineospora sp. UTMC 2448 TaxID=2268449 RepID=UPI002164AC8C|nr:S8 family serine peptidase [Actinokineospora sp. UTMC 2448]UVS81533.1 Subtilisin E precursor [Actinokineospora sp. UTMC 2448]